MENFSQSLFERQFRDILTELRSEIVEIVKSNLSMGMRVKNKDDCSPVTQIDIEVSNLVRDKIKAIYPTFNFFSEEEKGSFDYPVVILDPIDGTKELIAGTGECAVSLGIYFSDEYDDPKNVSWIFNPFSGFEISSLEKDFLQPSVLKKKGYTALVSRSEFLDSLFSINNQMVTFIPRGSIAFKLGLLASGACDFVVSKREKNIWDIAAGTHICRTRGIKLFVKNKEITKISQSKMEKNSIWTHSETAKEIISIMKNEF